MEISKNTVRAGGNVFVMFFYKTCRMFDVLVSMQQFCKCDSHAMVGAILLCTLLECSRHELVDLHVATIGFTAFALGT